MVLIAIEWILYVFAVTGALVSGLTLLVAVGVLTPVAAHHRLVEGTWPSWAAKLGAALAIAGTAALFLGIGIGYVVSR